MADFIWINDGHVINIYVCVKMTKSLFLLELTSLKQIGINTRIFHMMLVVS